MSDQPTEQPLDDPERLQAIEEVYNYLKDRQGGATLMGRFFDVSKDKGKRGFAEWLVGVLWDVNAWLDEKAAGGNRE